MDEHTRLRLEDMLRFARYSRDILGDVDAAALASNIEKQLALCRAIEIVGEAANAIASVEQAKLPSLPWRPMISMRHRLIHGYASIDLRRLVDTVRTNIPPLNWNAY